MRKTRVNIKGIAGYVAAAGFAGLTALVFMSESPEPEIPESLRQSNTMREAIERYLPFARDMVMAAPEGVAYPTPPNDGDGPQATMREAFDTAEGIIGNPGEGRILVRCDTLVYLREVHRIATEAYIAAGSHSPDVAIDLPAHQRAIAEAPSIAPMCKIR